MNLGATSMVFILRIVWFVLTTEKEDRGKENILAIKKHNNNMSTIITIQ